MPYIGEIRLYAGTYEPNGWLFCQGQMLPISENDVLFTLIGTTYGGDGQETFALPNLSGRLPIHMGTAASGATYQIGEMDGVESVTLTASQMPLHDHPAAAAVPAVKTSPVNNLAADTDATLIYADGDLASARSSPNALAPAGGSQPHDNMMPFLCVNFIISLYGDFPSPT